MVSFLHSLPEVLLPVALFQVILFFIASLALYMILASKGCCLRFSAYGVVVFVVLLFTPVLKLIKDIRFKVIPQVAVA
jgi:hypothetical protein